MNELREQFKGFDWYYDFSDDADTWRKWSIKKKQLIEWIKEKGYTKDQVMQIVKECASDYSVQRSWETAL